MNTKYMTVMVAMAVTVTMAFAQDANQDPQKLVSLRAKYEKDVKAALTPINKQYLAALSELKKDLGAKGEIEDAMAVQKEIDQYKPTEQVSQEPSVFMLMPKKEDPIVGKWKWCDGRILTINKDGTFEENENTWKPSAKKKGVYVFSWGHTGTVSKDGKTMIEIDTNGTKWFNKRIAE